jgi:uncharacterized protein involved in type VI secretion and phage assembly
MDFQAFYETLILRGLEPFKKYYGFYRGTVMRNDDPEKRGRIQVKVLQVGHMDTLNIWVDPAFDAAGTSRGGFFPPEVGDSVRVAFEHGQPEKPVLYIGGWFGTADLPSELAYTEGAKVAGVTGTRSVPEKRGFVTRKGHRLIFNDTKDTESVELSWHQPDPSDASVSADTNGDRSKTASRTSGKTSTLLFDSEGNITITNANGSRVHLSSEDQNIVITDENDNVITMDSTGITLDSSRNTKIVLKADQVELASGADTPAVRGRELDTWLRTHTHGTAWGPSSPPLTPPPPTILSKSVKLR